MFGKVEIYYFSGTGNSKNCALWFAERVREAGAECLIHDIARIDRTNIQAPDSRTLLVFASPVHGFNYPPVMINFLLRFPKGNSPVVLINTRAGMLIRRWITPGLSGIAFYLAAIILALKGYSFRAFYPVNLPSNWIFLHPGLTKRAVEYLHEKNKERVTRFADAMMQGKKNFRSVFEIVQDALIAPISLGYYFVGRFFLAKTYIASSACDTCGVCEKNCPVKAITMIDGRPYWTIHCESCMKCLGSCPKKAIETAHGLTGIVLAAYYGIITALLYAYVYPSMAFFGSGIVQMIVESALLLAFTSAVYYLAHKAMKRKTIERFLVYTSLTKYKFWGRRYKAPRS